MASFNLDKQMSKAASTQSVRSDGNEQSRTKAKREQSGESLSTLLWTALMTQWKIVKEKGLDPSTVEIEARIGMLVRMDFNKRWSEQVCRRKAVAFHEGPNMTTSSHGLEFKAGVDEIFFVQHLRRKILIEKNGFNVHKRTNTTVRSTNSSLRWVVLPDDKIKLCESKERYFRCNYGLLAHVYDLRVDGAVEIPCHQTAVDYNAWTKQRTKDRTTYIHNRFRRWQIDLTEVRVNLRSSKIREAAFDREYELEFELLHDVTVEWLRLPSETDAMKYTDDIVYDLDQLLDCCIPSEDDIQDDVNLSPAHPNEYSKDIRELNESILETCYRAGYLESQISLVKAVSEFIGSMPCNMSRRSLQHVLQNEYFVTEKSDGVRYLLYIVNDSAAGIASTGRSSGATAVFMNRSKEVYRVPGGHQMGKIFKVGTVLDCELVYNKKFKSQLILVFDVLALDRQVTAHLPFKERLALLDSVLNNRMSEYISQMSLQSNNAAIKYMVRKKYLIKSDIGVLLSKIILEHGERVYAEPDGRRHHKSDGLIFQPASAPYKFFSDQFLLKWKWSDMRTVDLMVGSTQIKRETSDPVIQLTCAGPDDVTIDCTKRGGFAVSVPRFDCYRLLADISASDLPATGHRIVEVMYDSELGQWKYFKFRRDKSRSNFIDTVLSVFVEQAEDISIEELEYSLIARDNQPDFRSVIIDERKRLIEETRRESRK